MKTRYKTICLSLSIVAISSTAFADKMNSETCAASLTPTGKIIFEAVAPSVEAETNKRKDAKANAAPAGECLLLLKQEKQSHSET